MKKLKLMKLIYKIHTNSPPPLEEIEKMGLLAVKIAQYYALRADFIDESTCVYLAKLYEYSYEAQKQDIDDIIGGDMWILTSMKSYEKMPFASASIGQVHLGYLRNNENKSEKVAIKIRREDFKKKFLEDIVNARKVINTLLFFYPKLKKIFNPLEVLNNIEESTLRELDFKNEVEGAKYFERLKKENEKRFDLEELKFSEFIDNLCTEKVAVSKYIEGKSFNTLLKNGELKYEDLLKVFKYHSFYMFKLGVFHGDLHPGNIILDPKGCINLIDCSTIGRVKNKLRVGLFWFFYYLCRYDYDKAVFYLNEMSEKELVDEKYLKFKKDFKELYSDFKNSTVSQVSLTRRMMETIKLAINSGMEFEEGMFHIIKSLMYLDGMVLKCNPNINLMNDIREFTALLESDKL
ncbi:AarF/ABC1/UbiB kinase family protein [Cetobacterium somerae]|uniref:AarF/UbiB family protein n=1 Tax=Cetobacterium sp. NK01 TaxID=2993530 RepID=UPI0021172321|nr:AarF/ABC1/UbiB kinase family protein [Cetobacterium sp. NK01]MCQ8212055.1 AarF/ABC1/UbiB kinase family protein [Cetobacterium sp. NK01]